MDLATYHVSEDTGFLLDNPLTELPEYFRPWVELGEAVGQHLEQHTLRDEVHKLLLLDAGRLIGHRQKRLANALLSALLGGYVWQEGDQGVAKIVPRQLAVPFCKTADDLGLPYILTYAGVVLANWRLLDPEGEVTLRNMDTICVLRGGRCCSWFFLVSAQVELSAIPGLKAVPRAIEGVATDAPEMVLEALKDVKLGLGDMLTSTKKMDDNLSPEDFYNTVRPFLSGWGGDGSAAPDGIVFEGVSPDSLTCIGGSAAQSPTLQVFDALLGITHPPERQIYLDKMADYMLPSHRAFITAVREASSVREYVLGRQDLAKAYNLCVKAAETFRSYHIQLVTRYIVIPAQSNANAYESLSNVGTGGTDILPFLKSLRDSTKAAKQE